MSKLELEKLRSSLPYRYSAILSERTGLSRGTIKAVISGKRENNIVISAALTLAEENRDNESSLCKVNHNHPSGNKRPSESDIKLTNKLKNGGLYLEIAVLDHIIMAEDEYYSFADEGEM